MATVKKGMHNSQDREARITHSHRVAGPFAARSLAHMACRLQYPLGFALAAVVLASVAAIPSGGAPDKLPGIEPKKHESYTELIPGSEVKFEMIAIPGGTYLMGSPGSEKDRGADEGPQH